MAYIIAGHFNCQMNYLLFSTVSIQLIKNKEIPYLINIRDFINELFTYSKEVHSLHITYLIKKHLYTSPNIFSISSFLLQTVQPIPCFLFTDFMNFLICLTKGIFYVRSHFTSITTYVKMSSII